MTREHGWECPKCQRIWAPRIAACGACNTLMQIPAYVGTPRTPISYGYPNWSYTSDDKSFVD